MCYKTGAQHILSPRGPETLPAAPAAALPPSWLRLLLVADGGAVGVGAREETSGEGGRRFCGLSAPGQAVPSRHFLLRGCLVPGATDGRVGPEEGEWVGMDAGRDS